MTKHVTLDTALRLHQAGLSVLRVKEDGSKEPLGTWSQYETTRATEHRLRQWFQYGRNGIGTVAGKVSDNLEMLEFDDMAAYDDLKHEAKEYGLQDLVTRIEEGYSEVTPGGGIHWYYRCDEISHNTKLASRPRRPEEMRSSKDTVKVLIETRGEGGYVVMAPSGGKVHPTEHAYKILHGSVETIATITAGEREQLWALAISFDQMHEKVFTPSNQPSTGTPGERPGDIFNERSNWRDVLEPHGWRLLFERSGIGYWCRPGKDRGVSATTNAKGTDTLHVFSTSQSEFDTSPSSYRRFSAYALLNHGGDWSAAGKALYSQGYRAPEPEPKPPPHEEPCPDEAGPCAELVERLRDEIAELRTENATLNRKLDDLREQNSLQFQVLRVPSKKPVRETGVALTRILGERLDHDKDDTRPWAEREVRVYRAEIAQQRGVRSVEGTGRALAVLDRVGLIRKTSHWETAEAGGTEQGAAEPRKITTYALMASPAETLSRLRDLPADAIAEAEQILDDAREAKGKSSYKAYVKVARCPDCPTGTPATHTCLGCGRALAELPDEPDRVKAPSVLLGQPDASGEVKAGNLSVRDTLDPSDLERSKSTFPAFTQIQRQHQAAAPIRARTYFPPADRGAPLGDCPQCGGDWVRSKRDPLSWQCRVCDFAPSERREPPRPEYAVPLQLFEEAAGD